MPPGVGTVHFRIHGEACLLPNAGLDGPALRGVCGLGDPKAGLGIQVVWLVEGIEAAARALARVAPAAMVVGREGLRPGRRAIFVARAKEDLGVLLAQQEPRDPVMLLVAAEHELMALPGSIGIIDDRLAPETAAGLAGIVAGLLTKIPRLSADEVRGVLLTLAN